MNLKGEKSNNTVETVQKSWSCSCTPTSGGCKLNASGNSGSNAKLHIGSVIGTWAFDLTPLSFCSAQFGQSGSTGAAKL
jgi:hypothetical protein